MCKGVNISGLAILLTGINYQLCFIINLLEKSVADFY